MFTGFVAIFIFPTVKDGIVPSGLYFVKPMLLFSLRFNKFFMNISESWTTITIVFSLRMSYNVMYCESVNAFNKK